MNDNSRQERNLYYLVKNDCDLQPLLDAILAKLPRKRAEISMIELLSSFLIRKQWTNVLLEDVMAMHHADLHSSYIMKNEDINRYSACLLLSNRAFITIGSCIMHASSFIVHCALHDA